MSVKSEFKFSFCATDVIFHFPIYFNFCFIYHPFAAAFTIQRTFRFLPAVTRSVAAVRITLLYSAVVGLHYSLHVAGGTVTNFHCFSIEDTVQLVVYRKVAVEYFQEFFAKVCF